MILSLKKIFLGTMITIITGCTTIVEKPPVSTYTKQSLPEFMLIYHPYGSSMEDRTIAAPIPEYAGWTESRMSRDLHRISNVGIDVILVQVDVTQMVVDDMAKVQLKRFYALAGLENKNLRIALVIRASTTLSNSKNSSYLSQFTKWYQKNIHNSYQSAYKQAGRSIIFLDGKFYSRNWHPIIKCVKLNSGEKSQWIYRHNGNIDNLFSYNKSEAFVPAAYKGNCMSKGDWELPRKAGRTLRRQLWKCYTNKPKQIIISSWNNFSNGDFVEPNSLDGEEPYQALKKEISRLRASVNTPLSSKK